MSCLQSTSHLVAMHQAALILTCSEALRRPSKLQGRQEGRVRLERRQQHTQQLAGLASVQNMRGQEATSNCRAGQRAEAEQCCRHSYAAAHEAQGLSSQQGWHLWHNTKHSVKLQSTGWQPAPCLWQHPSASCRALSQSLTQCSTCSPGASSRCRGGKESLRSILSSTASCVSTSAINIPPCCHAPSHHRPHPQ